MSRYAHSVSVVGLKAGRRCAVVRFRAGSSVLLLQHPPGRVVEVIELALLYGPQEEQGEHASQDQGNRQEEDDGVHASPFFTRRSTRSAPQMTSPLESGMSSAATSGLTNPAAAAETATTL